MKIVIIGQGVAGKSILRLLTNSVSVGAKIESIVIIDSPVNNSRSANLYTGLWSPAVRIMQDNLGKTYKDFIKNSCPVSKSCYMNSAGELLATPKNGLQSSPNKPSLRFIRNSELLLTFDGDFIHPVVNKTIVSLKNIKDKLNVIVEGGDQYEADIIIAADGSFSQIRELIHQRSHSHYLKHRGYTVYRGHCLYGALNQKALDTMSYTNAFHTPQDIKSFQSWGTGARFAMVPTNLGLAWFAAVTSPKLSISKMQKTVKPGPLWNNTEAISDSDLITLQSRFKLWHNPIPSLINGTNQIVKTEAISFKRVIKGGLSTVPKDTKTAVFFLGDASHTLDPILAQGAGVAIEDAYLAFQAINKYIFGSPFQDGGSKFIDAIKFYESARQQRLTKLHDMSNLAQFISHMNYDRLNDTRDKVMKVIPNFVKGVIFDKFINDVSTSYAPTTTTTPATIPPPKKSP